GTTRVPRGPRNAASHRRSSQVSYHPGRRAPGIGRNPDGKHGPDGANPITKTIRSVGIRSEVRSEPQIRGRAAARCGAVDREADAGAEAEPQDRFHVDDELAARAHEGSHLLATAPGEDRSLLRGTPGVACIEERGPGDAIEVERPEAVSPPDEGEGEAVLDGRGPGPRPDPGIRPEAADGKEATALDSPQGTEVEFGAGSAADPEQVGPRSGTPGAGKAYREDVIREARPAQREEP